MAERPLIVILGPTASGKTSLSLTVAKNLNDIPKDQKGEWGSVEIVNADSRQLYRALNIGTAKITAKDMQGIPHHLIDVCDPKEEVTAAWFQSRATETIKEIHARRNIPFLVGGSMLYISAIIDNLQFPPTSDPQLRSRLEEEYDSDEGESLYKQLEEEDPETARKFHRHNKPYLVRASELLKSVGKPSQIKKKGKPLFDLLIFGLQWEREELSKRINERTRAMLDAGWIEEVEGLLNRGYGPKDPGMKSEGYREIMAFLRGEMEKEELAELIAAKTRQYAKRQMTWWGKDPRIRWISVSPLKAL